MEDTPHPGRPDFVFVRNGKYVSGEPLVPTGWIAGPPIGDHRPVWELESCGYLGLYKPPEKAEA